MNDNEKIIIDIKELYATADPSKIRSLIAKHFIPSESEKKNNAEIPTPVKLVDEMLNTIPAEFWKTPKRVFEPCCGKGNFVLGIFDKFYNALDYTKPSAKCKVIIEQCLYYADITELNVFITTEILKCHIQKLSEDIKTEEDMKKYMENIKFNSYVGDTLKLNIDNTWGVKKGFDAVIGNPPYQKANKNKGTGNTLWNEFVNKAIEVWLLEDGYLLFVHPRGWRQIGNKTGILMRTKQIIYLNMNDVKKGLALFKASTDYDYYLLENKDVYKETIINDYQDKEYSYLINDSLKFIPNHSFKDVFKIISKTKERDNGFIYSRSAYATEKDHVLSKIKKETYEDYTKRAIKDGFKYPCVYSINAKNIVSLRWSSTKDNGHFGIKKFIFSNGQGYIQDVEGKYGLTEWAYAIKCKEEDMQKVEKSFISDEFKNIVDAIHLTSNKYNHKILTLFKKDFWKIFL